jgi:Lactonase, 7-bladed beta-propeller
MERSARSRCLSKTAWPSRIPCAWAGSRDGARPPQRSVCVSGERAGGAIGEILSAGGENSIAVYAIKQQTGEPTLIQNIETPARGMTPRTFALDDGAGSLLRPTRTRSVCGRASA